MDYLPRPEDLLVLVPGAAAGALLLLLARVLAPRKVHVLPAAFAFAAAHLVSYWMIKGLPTFPGVQSSERMFYGVAAFAAGSAIVASLPARAAVAHLLRGALAALLVGWLVHPLLGGAVSTLLALSLAVAIALWWRLVEGLTVQPRGSALALCVSIGLLGQILVLFGSASLAQLAGAASMTLGAAVLVGLPRAAVGGLAGVFAAISLDGAWFLVDPPPAATLALIAAAPVMLGVGRLERVRRMRPLPRSALLAGLVALPLAVAFLVALSRMPAADDLYR